MNYGNNNVRERIKGGVYTATAIISIDGGGMKGIISATILIKLEEYIRIYSKDKTATISEYVDLVAGTSTGSILTALLLCPGENGKAKYTAQEALNLYLQRGKEMFHKKPFYPINTLFGLLGAKYTNKYFKEGLKEYFGDLTVSQLLKPCLLPTYNMQERKTEFINTVSGQKSANRNYLLRDAVLASCSAPTYFPPTYAKKNGNCSDCLIDGGVFANNPAMCAVIEALKLEKTGSIKDIHILSIGNASNTKGYTYDEVKHWGIIKYALPLLNVLMDSSEEIVDYQLAKMYYNLGTSQNYIRVEAKKSKDIPAMDDTSDAGMKKLQEIGVQLAKKNDFKLRAFAKFLVDNKSKQ